MHNPKVVSVAYSPHGMLIMVDDEGWIYERKIGENGVPEWVRYFPNLADMKAKADNYAQRFAAIADQNAASNVVG